MFKKMLIGCGSRTHEDIPQTHTSSFLFPLRARVSHPVPVKTEDTVTTSFPATGVGESKAELQSFVCLQTVLREQTKHPPTGCYKQPRDLTRERGEGREEKKGR